MGTLGKVLVTAMSVAGFEPALRLMRDAGCEVVVETAPQPPSEAWLMEQARDVAGLIVAMEPVTQRVLEAAPALRIIARPGVGYDTVDMAAATRRGVAVTIAAGTNDQSVADFTMGLMLMSARAIHEGAASVRDGGWARTVGTELWRKTLAVVGFGRIGQAVAQRALGFEMRVLAVGSGRESGSVGMAGVQRVTLEQALAEADIVSLHLPLNEQTQGLFDATRLAAMKRGAYLINTARGGVIDEPALVQAVRSGHLAGAAVDVLQVQGAGSPSPLIGEPRIVVTPHMATFSRESMQRVAMAAAGSIVAALRGERPSLLVNPEAWSGTPL